MESIKLTFYPLDTDGEVFHAEVPEGLFSGEMILTRGIDRTLMLYCEDEWNSMRERLRTLPFEKVRRLRLFFAASVRCCGRGDAALTVPKVMLDHAGIESAALLERAENGNFLLRKP